MNFQAYPEVSLSLQWANPKSSAQLRTLLPRHTVARAIRHAVRAGLQELMAKKPAAHAVGRGQLAPQAFEIAVRVVEAEEGRALNQQYRGKDYATNVLTFDYAFAPVLQADLVLCAPVLVREAGEQAKDLRAHALHLLVHGTLHALGFDHEQCVADAARMEALEIVILQGLGMGNPYEA